MCKTMENPWFLKEHDPQMVRFSHLCYDGIDGDVALPGFFGR